MRYTTLFVMTKSHPEGVCMMMSHHLNRFGDLDATFTGRKNPGRRSWWWLEMWPQKTREWTQMVWVAKVGSLLLILWMILGVLSPDQKGLTPRTRWSVKAFIAHYIHHTLIVFPFMLGFMSINSIHFPSTLRISAARGFLFAGFEPDFYYFEPGTSKGIDRQASLLMVLMVHY